MLHTTTLVTHVWTVNILYDDEPTVVGVELAMLVIVLGPYSLGCVTEWTVPDTPVVGIEVQLSSDHSSNKTSFNDYF